MNNKKPETRRVRVVVVDDSLLERRLLCAMLKTDPGIEVVGSAGDAYEARDAIKRLNPDVLTLDVEMPKMNGLAFLQNLMRLRPMPVVMVSANTARGTDTALAALEMGAVDAVAKPCPDNGLTLTDFAGDLCRRVRLAGGTRVGATRPPPALPVRGVASVHDDAAQPGRLIALGASTGGVEALRYLFERLPAGADAYLIAQHLPETFVASFAHRLDAVCEMPVKVADDGEAILAGRVYLAPGGRHLRVAHAAGHLLCDVAYDPPVNRHRPSIDVLFASVAAAGVPAVGVLLTGMGTDGAQGLAAMRAAGALTLAQDEASAVVWGMAGAAVRAGAVDRVMGLGALPAALCVPPVAAAVS